MAIDRARAYLGVERAGRGGRVSLSSGANVRERLEGVLVREARGKVHGISRGGEYLVHKYLFRTDRTLIESIHYLYRGEELHRRMIVKATVHVQQMVSQFKP